MSILKKVLLARPHTFIVSEMRPFLEKAGLSPVKLDSLADIETASLGVLNGAVISTAVVSSVGASAEEVFAALRRKFPRLPVLFAGLTEFSLAKSAVERAVKPIHESADILPIASATEMHPGLGRENVFIALRKEDLAPGAPAELAERIVRKHFR